MKLNQTNYESIAQIFNLYCTEHPTGGSLHIVLEDGNVDRSSIQYCLKYAVDKQDWLGAFLADILLQLSDRAYEELLSVNMTTIADIFLFDLTNAWETTKTYIPKISNTRLAELAARIKPIIREHDKCYHIVPVDLRTIAYTWSPKLADEITTPLIPIRDITTYHVYGVQAFFKPSVAEVLSQIPEDIINDVIAFEIIQSPETMDDLNANHEATNAGYHVATTRLYRE